MTPAGCPGGGPHSGRMVGERSPPSVRRITDTAAAGSPDCLSTVQCHAVSTRPPDTRKPDPGPRAHDPQWVLPYGGTIT